MGEFHALPASVGTGPEVASWAEEHARDTFLPNGYSGSGPANASSFYREPQDIRNESPSVEVNTDAEVSSVSMTSPSIEEQGNETATSLYRFPVSSSPVDIVTMLTRLATFTGMVLKVLTPKLKRHTVPLVDQQVSHSLSLSPSPPFLSSPLLPLLLPLPLLPPHLPSPFLPL